jgi:excinuclease UvrABC helicase subunit UvrB
MLREGEDVDLDAVIRKLVDLQYERNELNFVRGKFRVRGDTLEIFPADGETGLAGRVLRRPSTGSPASNRSPAS